MYSALSTLSTATEMPLSKAPNPQLLPGRRSIGCPLLRVCVHFGWDKCRAQIPSMGHHTWPHVTVTFLVTMVPAALRSLTRSSNVVLG